MLYKPRYCCNCGEKIERVEWNLLTSRRFCAACFEEQKRHDYLFRAVVICGALGLVFGLGSFIGGAQPSVQPLQTPSSTAALLKQPSKDQHSPENTAESEPEQEAQDSQKQPVQAVSANPAQQPKQVNATVYYCGALTKKGTPCSRKVKGRGLRCFQHEGKPAAPQQN